MDSRAHLPFFSSETGIRNALRRFPVHAALLDLLSRPSFLFCLVAAITTIGAKHDWLFAEEHVSLLKTPFVRFISKDMMLFAGAAALGAALENLWSPARYATAAACFVLTLVGVINAIWLYTTGNQLSFSVVQVAFQNPEQNFAVAIDVVAVSDLALLAACILGPLGFFLGIHFVKKRLPPSSKRAKWSLVMVLAAVFAGFLVCDLAIARPKSPEAKSMAKNVHLSLVRKAFGNMTRTLSKQVLPSVDAKLRGRSWPPVNVVLVVVDSCSYRYSSFGSPDLDLSPFLAKLAGEGLFASNMRSVLPHTTKSTFSMLCGAYPSMETELVETADNFENNCLPRILGKVGYSSAFFQSANGEFENRSRLVGRIGFQEFWPRQRIGSEELCYVNGDDFAMIRPAVEWIQKHEEPFFLTFLTSVTHIPYILPKAARNDRTRKVRRRCGSGAKCNYEAAYAATDQFVEQLFASLEGIGALDNTVLIITGDHGEAFGEHGVRAHDNVYYDEVLHVPYIVWAKNRIKPGSRIDEPRSLVDTFPTVLDLVGLSYDRATLAGTSLLKPQPPGTKRYFTCWYDGFCRGFVEGETKLVYIPNERTHFSFNLQKDAEEKSPVENDSRVRGKIRALDQWMNQHQHYVPSRLFQKKRLFDYWICNDTERGDCQFDKIRYASSLTRYKPEEDEGLSATYFSVTNLGGQSRERIDHMVDFSWHKGSAVDGFPRDRFSAVWEGCVVVQDGESPILAAGGDDEVLLYVDGVLSVENAGMHSYAVKKAKQPLAPGIHRVRMEFTEWSDGARVFLGWSRDGGEPETIAPDRLVPRGGNRKYPCPDKAFERPDGLMARYFASADFSGTAVERIDRTVDFDWKAASPADGVPAGPLSVRWEGCLRVDGGPPTFLTAGATGRLRVIVDKETIIDQDTGPSFEIKESGIPLAPGVRRITIEYSKAEEGQARVSVGWMPQKKRQQWIPASRLVPLGGDAKHPCPP